MIGLTRLVCWATVLVWPHLLLPQAPAVVVNVVSVVAAWSFLAVDRDMWRQIAHERRPRPKHVNDLTGTAPWLPRAGQPLPQRQRGDR